MGMECRRSQGSTPPGHVDTNTQNHIQRESESGKTISTRCDKSTNKLSHAPSHTRRHTNARMALPWWQIHVITAGSCLLFAIVSVVVIRHVCHSRRRARAPWKMGRRRKAEQAFSPAPPLHLAPAPTQPHFVEEDGSDKPTGAEDIEVGIDSIANKKQKRAMAFTEAPTTMECGCCCVPSAECDSGAALIAVQLPLSHMRPLTHAVRVP